MTDIVGAGFGLLPRIPKSFLLTVVICKNSPRVYHRVCFSLDSWSFEHD